MLNTISNKFHSWTSGWRVLLLFILNAVMTGYIMPVTGGILALIANNSVLPLDVMFFYTPAKAFAMIEKYTTAGRSFYTKVELSVDILYPIVYTLFLGLLLSWLFQRAFPSNSPRQKWNVTPVGAWLFDLLENIAIVSLLAIYPSKPTFIAWLAMLFGTLKWAFVLISIGLAIWGLVKAAMNQFKKQA